MTDKSMDTAAPIVTQQLTMELVDHTGFALPLQGELLYDARDPYAAVVAFHTDHGVVRWTFGRDLLVTGIYEATGDGDVHVWPSLDSEEGEALMIELTADDGCAVVQAPLEDVCRFVDRITTLVRPGTESRHLDVDAAIAALLGPA
jgi:hypothetical protein